MLVLSRRKGESITIGEDVELTVVDIRRSRVRLGISAPKQTPVHRKEIYLSIQQENNNTNEHLKSVRAAK